MSLTECLKVFITETYQPITIGNNNPSHLSEFNHFHELVKLLAVALQAPVVRVASGPGMFLAGRDLLVIQIEISAIAPRDLQDDFP